MSCLKMHPSLGTKANGGTVPKTAPTDKLTTRVSESLIRGRVKGPSRWLRRPSTEQAGAQAQAAAPPRPLRGFLLHQDACRPSWKCK